MESLLEKSLRQNNANAFSPSFSPPKREYIDFEVAAAPVSQTFNKQPFDVRYALLKITIIQVGNDLLAERNSALAIFPP
jgi:hypothetical protein